MPGAGWFAAVLPTLLSGALNGTPIDSSPEEPSISVASAWGTSLDAAREQATREGKLVVVSFTGSDWCYWCRRLHREVFEQAEFAEWAATRAILVELDFPRTKSLPGNVQKLRRRWRERYDVDRFPTVLVLDAQGRERARTGYLAGGARRWVAEVSDLLGESRPSESEWLTSSARASEEARVSGRPILAWFRGSDWSPWCRKLDEEVFATPQFRAWAEQHVILLDVDFPRREVLSDALRRQNGELERRYGVRGYPTILLLDATGAPVGRGGYKSGGSDVWIRRIEQWIDSEDGESKDPSQVARVGTS